MGQRVVEFGHQSTAEIEERCSGLGLKGAGSNLDADQELFFCIISVEDYLAPFITEH